MLIFHPETVGQIYYGIFLKVEISKIFLKYFKATGSVTQAFQIVLSQRKCYSQVELKRANEAWVNAASETKSSESKSYYIHVVKSNRPKT